MDYCIGILVQYYIKIRVVIVLIDFVWLGIVLLSYKKMSLIMGLPLLCTRTMLHNSFGQPISILWVISKSNSCSSQSQTQLGLSFLFALRGRKEKFDILKFLEIPQRIFLGLSSPSLPTYLLVFLSITLGTFKSR